MKKKIKQKKNLGKRFLAGALAFTCLVQPVDFASAKTYYFTKFGSVGKHAPYKSDSIDNEVYKRALYYSPFDKATQSKTYDFDQDGTKEKVTFSGKIANSGVKSVTISINGNAVDYDFGERCNTDAMMFFVEEVDGEKIGIIHLGYCGEESVILFHWTDEDDLELLKELDGKSHINAYAATDKGDNTEYLYVEDSIQLCSPKQWPAQFKKYKKKKNVSVTKRIFRKYSYGVSGLTLEGKDIYYEVGGAYE